MKRRAQVLVLALGCALAGGQVLLGGSALDDLINAGGRGLPNVPDVPPPERVDGPDTDDSDRAEAEAERQREAQAEAERRAQAERERREQAERERQRLEQERLEQERQRLERERLAREEQERLRREAEARRQRLRQQAADARQHWVGEDERNRAAFDDVFGNSTTAGGGDPNVVDLSTAHSLTPSLLRGQRTAGPTLRTKPPPLPPAEFTIPAGAEAPEPRVLPFWRPDWERKLTDMGFAYASMYLKSKIDGLGSIPEMLKDSLDLRKKLGRRFTDHIENVFAAAQLATDPDANLGALSDRTERQFRSFAAAVDEDARNGIRDTIATTGGGSLGEGAEAAEFGVAAGREHLQDLQELKKWAEENPPPRR